MLGALAAMVVVVVVWVLLANQLDDRRARADELRDQTAAAQREAAALAPFRNFAAMRQKRVATVRSLAATRFDWGRVMRKVAVVLPRDVWLTALVGTVAPGVSVGAGAGTDTSGLRQQLPVPAIELTGCTTSQAEVARTMTRLRLIDGAQRVSLDSSEKPDSAVAKAGSSESAGGVGDSEECRLTPRIPKFSIVVFFDAQAGSSGIAPGDPTASSTGATQPGATSTSTSSSTSPSSTSSGGAGGAR